MATRSPLLATAALAVLALAACSDDSSPAPAAGGATTTVAAGGAVGTDPAGDPGGVPVAGDVDCAFLRDTDAANGLVGLQLMPQIRSQAQIDSVKTGPMSFDLDALAAYLTALRPLAGMETVLGDPGPVIEHYIASTEATKALLAIEGPVPQEQLDTYIALIGDPGEFIMGQAAIGAATDEVCG